MSASSLNDTIYALATPPGVSGVAIIRVSGGAALDSLCRLAGFSGAQDVAPRQAYFRTLADPVSRETIDQAVTILFRGPASFTGEDVAEYHVHGGGAVIQQMLDVLGRQEGHRMAESGEFTRRAFHNGKMDLTEAEAVADLIHAETQLQKQQALRQMGGVLNNLYEGWRKDLARILAYIEADLDFPDEDLPEGVAESVRPQIIDMQEQMTAHLDDNRRGERLRSGIKIAVIGAPNAGKSSLVNALAQRDVAIVSQHAGTTRDVIEVHLDLGGYPVIIADTAGLRPEALGNTAQDSIEAEGIQRAMKWAERADIRLLMFDASTVPDWDENSLNLIDDGAVVAINKIDELAPEESDFDLSVFGQNCVKLSVQNELGLSDLLSLLKTRVAELIGATEAPALTRERHREGLRACLSHLARAAEAGHDVLPELLAEDVRLAMRDLGRITGRVDVEDLLDIIFRDFCIGK